NLPRRKCLFTVQAHPRGWRGHLVAVALAPDGKRVVTGSDTEGKLAVFDVPSGRERERLRVPRFDLGPGMTLTRDGQSVVVGIATVAGFMVVELDTGAVNEIGGPGTPLAHYRARCLAVAPDSKTVVVASDDIRWWRLKEKKED